MLLNFPNVLSNNSSPMLFLKSFPEVMPWPGDLYTTSHVAIYISSAVNLDTSTTAILYYN